MNNTKTFTLTFKKMWKPIWDSRWYYFKTILLCLLIVWVVDKEDYVFLVIINFFVGVPLILQIILHLNYLFHDKKVQLIVDKENKEINYKNGVRELKLNFQDIKSIIRFQGSKYSKSFETYAIPSNFYHYTMIEFVNGEVILFSDFVCSDIGIYQPKKQSQIRPFLNLITKNYI